MKKYPCQNKTKVANYYRQIVAEARMLMKITGVHVEFFRWRRGEGKLV